MNKHGYSQSRGVKFLKKCFYAFAKFSRNKWFRRVFTSAVLVFCIIYLFNYSRKYDFDSIIYKLNWWELLLSTTLVFAAVFLGSVAWHLFLVGTGNKISPLLGIKIHLYSNITKYLPGTGWQYISKFVQLKETGTGAYISGMVMGFETAILIVTGAAVALFNYPWKQPLILVITIKLTAVLLIFAFPFLLAKLKSMKLINVEIIVPLILGASFLLVVNWNILGASLWYLERSLNGSGTTQINIYMFIYSVSIITGILILPVPNGIGIREGMLVFLLSKLAFSQSGEIMAGIARLQIFVGEAFMAGFIWILSRLTQNNTKSLLKDSQESEKINTN